MLAVSLAGALGAAEIAPDAASVTPLLIGSDVPSATVRQLDGSPVDLAEVVGEAPTVVIFFRGGW